MWPDLGKVVAEVRKAAAASPDHVYKTHEGKCKYTRGEGGSLVPDCIVGHGFAAAGVPLALLAEFDVETAAVDQVVAKVYPVERVEAEAANWLMIAQEQQDGGETWAEAVADADKVIADD